MQCLHHNHFKPLAQGGGGGEKNSLAEATIISNEENSSDFCSNYVQEFGLGVPSLNTGGLASTR
jgi:hypothetical protein